MIGNYQNLSHGLKKLINGNYNRGLKMACVRCNNEFRNNAHPLSHFFSICEKCREKSPETIMDQQMYNFRLLNKNLKSENI